MFKKASLSSTDAPPSWTDDELARFDTYMASKEPLWDPSDPPDRMLAPDVVSTVGPGHNGPPADEPDPLADLTPWQLFIDCIWISREGTYTKIMLLCIARFMEKQLRGGSSMSYSQIAGDCGFSEPTAKRCAKKVRERWLRILVGKGRYVPGKGSENLYHDVIPGDLLDELRRRKSGVSPRYPETSYEVSQGDPETDGGVSDGHPEIVRGIPQTPPGYLGDTLTPHTAHKKEERDAHASPPADAAIFPPNLNSTPQGGSHHSAALFTPSRNRRSQPPTVMRLHSERTPPPGYQSERQEKRKILVSFELHDDECLTDDGKAMTIHQRYTWSMHEKALLRRHLEAWRAKPFTPQDFGEGGFDIRKLLGVSFTTRRTIARMPTSARLRSCPRA
jgi:hypothetical protein